MNDYEVNFDGLVGPTHNYAGLSFGNRASKQHANATSNPKLAAKQGLLKMKALHDLGLRQGILAPQQRPDLHFLRQIGFSGNNEQILNKAAKHAPDALLACYSAANMWTANAATVSPSADTSDGKVHFTPANLSHNLHRSLEHAHSAAVLQAVFVDKRYFSHHPALPSHPDYGDEGAANHNRFCQRYDAPGLELFIYGQGCTGVKPQRYPARQKLAASQAIARSHGLAASRTLFMQQNPVVIDQGVFHNDVIAVANQNLFFFHEQAFVQAAPILSRLREFFKDDIHLIEVKTAQLAVETAIKSYLFNSQIVRLANNKMALIAPHHCQQSPDVLAYLQTLIQQNTPLKFLHFFDLQQSMSNGGGPACLRLRVALNEEELAAVNPHCLLTEPLFMRLTDWVDRHYRDRLSADDLRDPQLIEEVNTALDELSQILHLGSIYPFQQA